MHQQIFLDSFSFIKGNIDQILMITIIFFNINMDNNI